MHRSIKRTLGAVTLLASAAVGIGAAPHRTAVAPAMPRYGHMFVIIGENKGYHELMDHPELTPVLHRLAAQYGNAEQFYAEVHLSEANYIAMLGGDTFGIHDDDAFYCHAGVQDPYCDKTDAPGYADHDIVAPSLMDQLAAKGLTWKAYMEDIPAAGSLAPRWPTAGYGPAGMTKDLYAAKHNGFVNFRSVNREPYSELAFHFVGFSQLDRDLANDTMPAYAHIVPNQCNDMHGLGGPDVPEDCKGPDSPGLIRRGDAEIGVLVEKIMRSKVWSDPGNTAIVVTFDENNPGERNIVPQGCCGYDPQSPANFGGGHIVTIVITNHGRGHVSDPTPYNHYSLLRTTEAAFGIDRYLGQAADSGRGVVTMSPLFAVGR